jgi:hypothetical protein
VVGRTLQNALAQVNTERHRRLVARELTLGNPGRIGLPKPRMEN